MKWVMLQTTIIWRKSSKTQSINAYYIISILTHSNTNFVLKAIIKHCYPFSYNSFINNKKPPALPVVFYKYDYIYAAGLEEVAVDGVLGFPEVVVPLEPPPDEVPDEVPEDVPDVAPDEVPDEAPDDVPDDAPEDTPDELFSSPATTICLPVQTGA